VDAFPQSSFYIEDNFGSHGYYIENELINAKVIGIDSKDRIYLIGKKEINDLKIFYLKRIDSKGQVDVEYGKNGYVELRILFDSHHPTGTLLDKDKLIISFPYSLGWTDQPKNHTHGSYYHIYKICENGNYDSRFGDMGSICKAPGKLLNGNLNDKLLFTNSDTLIIADNSLNIDNEFLKGDNNKLNFRLSNYKIESSNDNKGNYYIGSERNNYNQDTDTIQIIKINSDLEKDTLFGNNGAIFQYFDKRKSILNKVDVIDTSIFISTSVYHLAEPVLYKYNLHGQTDISFGVEGILQLKKAIGIKDTINGRGGIRGLMKDEYRKSLFTLSIYNFHTSYNKYYLTELTMDGEVIKNTYLGSLLNQPIQNFILKNGYIYLPEKIKNGKTIIYKLSMEERISPSFLKNSKFDLFYNQMNSKDQYIIPSVNSISSYEIYNVLGNMIFKSNSREDLLEYLINLNGVYQISGKTTDDLIINDILILK